MPIHFGQAIPIAVHGLLVNLASVWLLSGDHHGHCHGHSHGHNHGHGHGHGHEDEHSHREEAHRIFGSTGVFTLSVFEDGVPPVFRITRETDSSKLNVDVPGRIPNA